LASIRGSGNLEIYVLTVEVVTISRISGSNPTVTAIELRPAIDVPGVEKRTVVLGAADDGNNIVIEARGDTGVSRTTVELGDGKPVVVISPAGGSRCNEG